MTEEFKQWLEENKNILEYDFVYEFPRESRPLDDDIPDFLSFHADLFDEYCVMRYKEEKEG